PCRCAHQPARSHCADDLHPLLAEPVVAGHATGPQLASGLGSCTVNPPRDLGGRPAGRHPYAEITRPTSLRFSFDRALSDSAALELRLCGSAARTTWDLWRARLFRVAAP